MASTFSTNNGFEKPATGEQSNTWGVTVDTDFDLIDTSLDGYISLTLTGSTYSLAITDGAASDGRNRVLLCTGSPGANCTITVTPNDAKKWYYVQNSTTGGYSVIIAQGGGSGATVTVANGYWKIVRLDGTGSNANVVEILASPSFGGTIKAATSVIPANTPGANLTVTQNSVAAITSVESGALVNSLYIGTGNVTNGETAPIGLQTGTRTIGVRGTSDFGVLEMSSGAADADGATVGSLQWADVARIGLANRFSAYIISALSGATANNRGGNLSFFTKANGGAATIAIHIDNIQNVGLGAAAHAKVLLDCPSTTKAFRPPAMTTTQRDAISGPATGSVIYNTTTNKLNLYTGAAWEAVTSA